MENKKTILAFESSCDDTALALVNEYGHVIADYRYSQIQIHNQFGGVVPEVASRSHEKELRKLFNQFTQSHPNELENISAIAATCGPGLIGPLLVGASFARGLSVALNKAFIGVHHLRAHVASVFLNSESAISMKEKSEKNFPAWCLLVSGGHSQILEVDSKLRIKKIAETSDDAAGECFDKSAKLMGLSYPGGPAIEQLAQKLLPKDKSRALELEAALPVPRSEKGFSFSGLKTAIRLKLEKDESLAKDPAFAWAIEKRIGETLMKTFERCFESHQPNISQLIFCGGVSANKSLRARMENFCTKESLELSLPSLKFCTDNAAMVAACAFLQDPSLKLTDVNAQIAL